MSSDSSSLVENQTRFERLRRFYELLVTGQYTAALEIADNQADFGGESERVVIEVLKLKLGIQKYVG